MILTVTPNPALDLTWSVDELVPGSSHRVDTGFARAGGKGLNVARVLHSLGIDTLALTTTGGESGDAFVGELEGSGIPHRLLEVARPTRRSLAIVDRAAGEPTLFNERGEGLARPEVDALLAACAELAGRARVVALCGSLPAGFDPADVDALVRSAGAHGAAVIVDTSGPGMLAAARAGASVLKPNRDELAEATGLADPLEGARALLEAGARIVVVSLGGDGLAVVTSRHLVRARPPEVLRGNATGAGDAAVAAICSAYADGVLTHDTPPEAAALAALARRAVAWSAAAVLMPLAGEIAPIHRDLETQVEVTVSTKESA